MTVRDKVFVVTGAGGGIGSELVMVLLGKGASVVAIDLRKDLLTALDAKANSDKLFIYTLGITNRLQVSEISKQIIAKQGNIDGLVNCAGIVQPFLTVNEIGYEATERVMKVNFWGTLHITKAFLPHLLTRPEASIVNVSSMGGFLPVPGQGIYGASKAAVKLMSEALYAELIHTNVHVTTVFPGATRTNITQNSGVKININPKDANIPMLEPARSADLIVQAIERNKPLMFVGKDARFMNVFYRLSPTLATKYIAKKMSSLISE